jgi:hypothetical protein
MGRIRKPSTKVLENQAPQECQPGPAHKKTKHAATPGSVVAKSSGGSVVTTSSGNKRSRAGQKVGESLSSTFDKLSCADYATCEFASSRVPEHFRHNPVFDFSALDEKDFEQQYLQFVSANKSLVAHRDPLVRLTNFMQMKQCHPRLHKFVCN